MPINVETHDMRLITSPPQLTVLLLASMYKPQGFMTTGRDFHQEPVWMRRSF